MRKQEQIEEIAYYFVLSRTLYIFRGILGMRPGITNENFIILEKQKRSYMAPLYLFFINFLLYCFVEIVDSVLPLVFYGGGQYEKNINRP